MAKEFFKKSLGNRIEYTSQTPILVMLYTI